jgi:hypothetical protein
VFGVRGQSDRPAGRLLTEHLADRRCGSSPRVVSRWGWPAKWYCRFLR